MDGSWDGAGGSLRIIKTLYRECDSSVAWK